MTDGEWNNNVVCRRILFFFSFYTSALETRNERIWKLKYWNYGRRLARTDFLSWDEGWKGTTTTTTTIRNTQYANGIQNINIGCPVTTTTDYFINTILQIVRYENNHVQGTGMSCLSCCLRFCSAERGNEDTEKQTSHQMKRGTTYLVSSYSINSIFPTAAPRCCHYLSVQLSFNSAAKQIWYIRLVQCEEHPRPGTILTDCCEPGRLIERYAPFPYHIIRLYWYYNINVCKKSSNEGSISGALERKLRRGLKSSFHPYSLNL